jgi:uncharacterized protein (DUF305 family)
VVTDTDPEAPATRPGEGRGGDEPLDPDEAVEVDDDDRPERFERWWTIGAFGVLGLLVVVLAFVVGRQSAGPGQDEVDIGFLQDMTSHHEQAVQMALTYLDRGEDSVTRSFAQEVILFQRWELGKMAAWLDERDVEPASGDPDRPVMGWMGMGGTLAEMPGMASQESLDRLAASEGREADLLFLELMSEHHRGGLHMSEYAAEQAADDRIRELAAVMARNQRAEIGEYARVIERLESQGDSEAQ